MGEESLQIAETLVVQHSKRSQNLEVIVHQQECIKQCRLMLKEQGGRKGVGTVIVRKMDIVEMNVSPRREPLQHLKDNQIHFPGRAKRMA